MRQYVEIKTRQGNWFQGWTKEVERAPEGVCVTLESGRFIFVPYTSLDYLDAIPEGHPSAPARKP